MIKLGRQNIVLKTSQFAQCMDLNGVPDCSAHNDTCLQ